MVVRNYCKTREREMKNNYITSNRDQMKNAEFLMKDIIKENKNSIPGINKKI